MNVDFALRFFTPIILMLSVVCQFGCSNKGASKDVLARDSMLFCDLHDVKHWRHIPSDMPIDEFHQLVNKRLKSKLKTSEYLTLVDELEKVEFYRQLYPEAKKRIEAIIETDWQCPQFKDFYSIELNKVAEGEGLPVRIGSEVVAEIVVKPGSEYYLNGEPLNLNSDELEKFVEGRDKDQSLTVKMNDDTTDADFQNLLKRLAVLNVSNVSVISD